MSNEGLRAEVNRLQSELNRIERINRELQGEVNTISSGIANANHNLVNYSEKLRSSLDNSNGVMVASVNTVLKAYEMQGEIQRLYRLYKNIETANKNIHACNNKRYYTFKNYRTVRKLMQGLMDNLDFNMVNIAAILRAVEVQHLQAPDYWLTCVLLSIMAWMTDDRELAQRAMQRAVQLNRKSASIFYMIFNLRVKRNDAAKKWFYEYQQCQLKGSDQSTFLLLFSLISDSLSTNADMDTKQAINDYLHKSLLYCAQLEGFSEEEILARIRWHITRLHTETAQGFNLIKVHCPGYSQLMGILAMAQTNQDFLEYLLMVKNVTAQEKNGFIKQYIEELIELPGEKELAVQDEIRYNEYIIQCNGEVEQATELYETQKTHDESDLNLFVEMIQWLYQRGDELIVPQMRRNMLVLSRSLHQKAFSAHRDEYRAQISHIQPVMLNDFSAQVNFANLPEAQNQVAEHYRKKAAEEKSTLKSWPAFVLFALCLAAVVGAFFTHLLLLALGGVCAVAGAVFLARNAAGRKKIDLDCAAKSQSAAVAMEQLFAEYAKYHQSVEYFDKYAEQVLLELENL